METYHAAFMAMLFSLPVIFVIDPFAVPLVFGLCLRFGLITDPVLLSPSFAGFGSDGFIAVTAALYLIHGGADKIPPLGHLMDAIGVVAKPVAVAFIGFVISSKIDPASSLHWISLAAMLAGGAPAAAALQLLRTKMRLATSASSMGLMLPFLSTAENVLGLGLSALVFTHPLLAVVLILVVGLPFAWLAWILSRAVLRGARGLVKRVRAGGR